ncbi:MAG: hypothetical protein DMD70_03355 [Gemmatimonadetes bacterium]|nr:MAG: hypothetical protein DMD70_03355 [Gemmatimonadota bacterium]
MDLGLAGRVALVCGSTKGLGRAVARILAQEGARVAINGRHEDSVGQVAEQLSSEAAQAVMPFVADVGDPAQAEGVVERVHHEMGRLDVLFCNASGPPAAPFTHQPAEAFHRAVELNLLSTVHLARAAVPIMRHGARRRPGVREGPGRRGRRRGDHRERRVSRFHRDGADHGAHGDPREARAARVAGRHARDGRRYPARPHGPHRRARGRGRVPRVRAGQLYYRRRAAGGRRLHAVHLLTFPVSRFPFPGLRCKRLSRRNAPRG